jgi:enoyl-CoA hydratase/carnithine racemase
MRSTLEMSDAVLYEVRDHVAFITLNRPTAKNALNRAMRKELQDAYTDVKYSKKIWVAILTGAGDVFCSGKDLFEAAPEDDGSVMSNDELYIFQRNIYKPIILAINGPCLAQGGGFALNADILIMSEARLARLARSGAAFHR